MMQKNEGQWQFSLDESSNGRSIELAVAICRYLDTSLIRADVQPQSVRLLIQVCPMFHSHAYLVRLDACWCWLNTFLIVQPLFGLHIIMANVMLLHCGPLTLASFSRASRDPH